MKVVFRPQPAAALVGLDEPLLEDPVAEEPDDDPPDEEDPELDPAESDDFFSVPLLAAAASPFAPDFSAALSPETFAAPFLAPSRESVR